MGVYLSTPSTEKISIDQKCKKYVYGASSMQGWRMTQEDAHNCISDFDEATDTSYFAVYDGHGGAEVAQYTASKLPDFIKNHKLYKTGALPEALQAAFLDFDATLTEESVIQELKTLAGVADDDDDNDVEDDEGMGRGEHDLLVAEANMPITELMSRYYGAPAAPAPKLKGLQRDKHASPAIRAKKPENAGGEQSVTEAGTADSVATRLESRLEQEQPDNDNNLNVEKELRDSQTAGKTSDKPVEPDSSSDIANTNNSNVSDSVKLLTNGEVGADSTDSVETKLAAKSVQVEKVDSVESVTSSSKNGEQSSDNAETPVATKSELEPSGSQSGATSSSAGSSETAGCSSSAGSSTSGCSSSAGSSSSSAGPSGSGLSSGAGSSGIAKAGGSGAGGSGGSILDEDYDSEDESSEEEEEYMSDSEDDDDDDDDDDEEDSETGGIFGVRAAASSADEEHTEEPGTDSGCTAVVVLVRENQVFVANAGDSRCVLCRGGTAVDLSFDHKPEDDSERSRIEAAGGKVTNDGRVNGGLNLSRALGDHWYKRNETKPAREQMISALPDVESTTLEAGDEFLIIACDGIWNYMTSQETVDFVRNKLKDPKKAEQPSIVCEELFDYCLAPNTQGDGTGCDNMTCIIVLLTPVDPAENKLTGSKDEAEESKNPAESRENSDTVKRDSDDLDKSDTEITQPEKRAKLEPAEQEPAGT